MRLHVKLSAMVLIKKQGVELALAEEELIEYGIIVAFTHGISTFLHQSFAEFFLAKSLLDKIDHDNKDKDKDLELILKESGFFLVRRFLNGAFFHLSTHGNVVSCHVTFDSSPIYKALQEVRFYF